MAAAQKLTWDDAAQQLIAVINQNKQGKGQAR
jgi:hypothetical protein